MQYVKVTFPVTAEDASDMLTALLADAGYDGFEEKENELLAYIPTENFDQDELDRISGQTGSTYTVEQIPEQNWNALWESNFDPVIVGDLCTVRAEFHNIEVSTPYDIVITPKMSFGTGHHATTQLMMLLMKEVSFKDKSVLDFGTGTGVLAILAELLGADEVLAIDNDEWSAENARENVARNHCSRIEVKQGSLEDTGELKTDIILANINRNILLQYMGSLYQKLEADGTILMSGLLVEDEQVIMEAAIGAGFVFSRILVQGNWIALIFNKI